MTRSSWEVWGELCTIYCSVLLVNNCDGWHISTISAIQCHSRSFTLENTGQKTHYK